MWNPQAPDLAVEVISPSDTPRDITEKVVNYLAAKTVVWIVYSEKQQVTVCKPGKLTKTFSSGDVIDGSDILPDFKLAVSDIFSE